jgi:hypothetical protein
MPSLSARDYAELTDELQDVFNETSASAIADAIGLQVFDVGETNLLNYEHQILHGVKGIEEVADGANLPKVNSQQGDNITYVQRYFGAIVAITKVWLEVLWTTPGTRLTKVWPIFCFMAGVLLIPTFIPKSFPV